jgi:hypothetical protein
MLTSGHPLKNTCGPSIMTILSAHFLQNTCGQTVHLITFFRIFPHLIKSSQPSYGGKVGHTHHLPVATSSMSQTHVFIAFTHFHRAQIGIFKYSLH